MLAELLHRRDEILWELIEGDGSAQSLVAFADRQWDVYGDALADDPQLGLLFVGPKGTHMRAVAAEQLPAHRRRFADYVNKREAYMRSYFSDVECWVDAESQTTSATVVGSVGVRLGPQTLLLSGRNAEPQIARQQAKGDFEGVPVPFVARGSLGRVGNVPRSTESVRNAITGAEVAPSLQSFEPTRSHLLLPRLQVDASWRDDQSERQRFSLRQPVVIGAESGGLALGAGVTLDLAAGVVIDCVGDLTIQGTPDLPVEIRGADIHAVIRCHPGATVRIRHARFIGCSLDLRGADCDIVSSSFTKPQRYCLAIGGGRANVVDCVFDAPAATGLHVAAAAIIRALDCSFVSTDATATGLTADGGSRVHVVGARFVGSGLSARAASGRCPQRSIVHLEDCLCPPGAGPHVAADERSEIELVRTRALPDALSVGRVKLVERAPLLEIELAAPR